MTIYLLAGWIRFIYFIVLFLLIIFCHLIRIFSIYVMAKFQFLTLIIKIDAHIGRGQNNIFDLIRFTFKHFWQIQAIHRWTVGQLCMFAGRMLLQAVLQICYRFILDSGNFIVWLFRPRPQRQRHHADSCTHHCQNFCLAPILHKISSSLLFSLSYHFSLIASTVKLPFPTFIL